MNSNSLLNSINTTSNILVILIILLHQKSVNSQIVPDRTLDSESSVVNSIDKLKEKIEGGAIRGSNLFHSFQEFNVGKGQSVYFINPAGIENILTRITGNNASNILGKLGVEGAANLFLINPNGILFGPNASLDIRGSFIATTGDEIKLGQNGLFSAINPENSNLLSVKPSALFFNQLASQTKGRIINQSMADGIGLAVPPGEKLGFVAREIILNGGRISGQQSSIELGAVGDESLVKINSTETGDTLDYSEVTNFRDIQIINGSAINNIGLGSGPIQIQGKDITVAGLSQITATTLGDRDGDTFSINASESLTIVDSLLVSNAEVTATGKGSNINVDTQNLTITEGGLLVVTTGGAGQGGDLRVKATEIKIVGGNPSLGENELLTSEIITNIAPGATGKGGNMTIDTQRLILRDGGVINTSVSGAGEGGELVVRAEEIEATGVLESVVIPSGLRTDVLPGGSGKGGNLTVNTEKLTLATGGQIGSGALSSGAGGNIEVNAVEISAIGTSFQGNESAFPPLTLLLQTLSGQLPSGLLTTVTPTATGDGGNLTVNTQKLTIEGGAQIGAGTFGQSPSGDVTIKASEIEAIGNAPGDQFSTTIFTSVFAGGSGQGGDLRVETQGLTLKDGAQIRAGTSAVGDSGDIILKANEILLIGRSSEKRSGSSIVAGVEDLTSFGLGRGIGDGGNISIETDRLSILDGAVISALTQGEGLAGSISINARENITLSRRDSTLNNPSAINASTEANATGEGGNISLATPLLNLDRGAVIRATSRSESNGGDLILNVDTLNLANGSQILTSSFSDGNAGTITINADSAITLSSIDSSSNNREVQIFNSETAIASESTNNGDAGSITINTPQLRVEDRAITVGSSGSGVAGSLNINAPSIELNNGTLSAETAAGDQGNITIQASEINLTNNSEITTNARNDATGGDIDIDTKFLIGLDNSNISANAIVGQGGNIAITGEGVFLDNSSEITATSALGIDGSVKLNTQVDPTQGVVKLSATVIDAQSLVAQNLCVATTESKQESSFVITGRGGLPPDPTQPLTVLRGTVGWESNTQEDTKVVMSESQQPVVVYRRPKNQNLPQITQAMGWVMTESGKVTLTSTANRINSASPQLTHPSCYLFTPLGVETSKK